VNQIIGLLRRSEVTIRKEEGKRALAIKGIQYSLR
jgi:hypothetical protein